MSVSVAEKNIDNYQVKLHDSGTKALREKRVNIITFINPLVFFPLLRPPGLEYHWIKAEILPYAANVDMALQLTTAKGIRD